MVSDATRKNGFILADRLILDSTTFEEGYYMITTKKDKTHPIKVLSLGHGHQRQPTSHLRIDDSDHRPEGIITQRERMSNFYNNRHLSFSYSISMVTCSKSSAPVTAKASFLICRISALVASSSTTTWVVST